MDGAGRDNKGHGGPSNGDGSRRLRSWKEIAAFFGKDVRTVKRWESRGLPVQRVPGGSRASVFADTLALELWISGKGEAPPTVAEAPGRSHRLALAGIALALAIGAGAVAITQIGADEAPQAKHQPPQK